MRPGKLSIDRSPSLDMFLRAGGFAAVAVGVLLGAKAFALTPEEMQEQTVLHASPQDLFRDYALSACLGLALPQISSQTSAAANLYVQYGEGPAEAYEAAAQAAAAFLKRDYVS